jgi:APA family basic amino acid/polyamine antiporter
MPKDHIELWLSVLPAFYIVVATAICIALLYTKLVQAVGVSWLCYGIPVYYLVKKKE